MNRRSAYRSGQTLLLLGSLLITALIVSFSLTSCAQQNTNTQGGDVPMTAEEMLDINAEIIRVELEERGWVPDRRSLEGASKTAAGVFAYASDQRIVSVESKQYESGDIDLTVTDAAGDVFVLLINSGGNCERVKDSEGNTVFALLDD